MPQFVSPFSGNANNRKLTKDELVRAMRFVVAAEYEAVQIYEQLAESIDDQGAAAVLRSVADEELVHAGEFLEVVYRLSPNEQGFYKQGAQEARQTMDQAHTTV